MVMGQSPRLIPVPKQMHGGAGGGPPVVGVSNSFSGVGTLCRFDVMGVY